MTRRILGEATLDDSQVHRYFPNSIGMVSDWRKRCPVYEVPFSALYASVVKKSDHRRPLHLGDGSHVEYHAGHPLLCRHRPGRRHLRRTLLGFLPNGSSPSCKKTVSSSTNGTCDTASAA